MYYALGMGKPHKSLVEGNEGKRLLGRLRHKGDDNIKINLKVMAWEDTVWIQLAKDRVKCRAVVNVVMKFWIP